MRDAIILGSGRSGTSMLAGTLAGAGWFVGVDPYPARRANPKGFFEAPDVNGINEELLARTLPDRPAFGAWQRWLSVFPLGEPVETDAGLDARIRNLTARRPFCFKDPRFCYTLPAWRPHLGDAVFLVVFRHPAVTAASILRECSEAEYLRGLPIDFEGALDVWSCMYRHVIETHRRADPERWLFLHYDQVLTGEGLDRVERHVGASVERTFPDARLRRTHCDDPVPGPVEELYGRLCELAAFEPGAAGMTPWPVETRATHRLLAWPSYDSDEDLDALMGEFARAFAGRDDVCLCLRHDAASDPPLEDAVDRIERSYALHVGEGALVDVLLLTETLRRDEWPRLGLAVSCVLELPSSGSRLERGAFLREVGAPVHRTARELERLLA